MTHVFGEFVGAHHLEAGVFNLLDKWMLTYQHEVAREAGLDPEYLPAIRSWRVSSEMGRMPEDQLPGVIIVNQGVLDPVLKHGDGTFTARWQVDVGCQAIARGSKTKAAPRALTLARMYALAIRLCMMQQREPPMGMVDWRGEVPNQVLDSEDDRTTCLATVRFNIETPNAVEWGEGPLIPEYVDPPLTARPEWPVVNDYELDIVKQPIDTHVQPVEEEG